MPAPDFARRFRGLHNEGVFLRADQQFQLRAVLNAERGE